VSELKVPLCTNCKVMCSRIIGNLVEVEEIATAMQDKGLSHDPADQSPDIKLTTVEYY
jgi:hypothetical protein